MSGVVIVAIRRSDTVVRKFAISITSDIMPPAEVEPLMTTPHTKRYVFENRCCMKSILASIVAPISARVSAY